MCYNRSMKNELRLTKVRAGYYTATAPSGRLIELEYTQTHYGDRGWMALVGNNAVTDYPRLTRAEALEVAVASSYYGGSR